MKRLFIAIKIMDLPDVKNVYEFVKSSLESERIKWVEIWNLHLTLVFLGDTEEEKLTELKTAIDNLTIQFQHFQLTIKSAGVFKSIENPTAIWFGIDSNQVLEEIKKTLDYNLNKIGLTQENKKFKPHLTIGRPKLIKDKLNLKNIIEGLQGKLISIQLIDKIILYESKLTQEGPIYKSIHIGQLQ
jgi:2'-5' RNA ligase